MKRLIVCEFADGEWTVPGSVFTHACAECKRLLMTAPSGQKMLQKYPEARLICKACYGPIRDIAHKDTTGRNGGGDRTGVRQRQTESAEAAELKLICWSIQFCCEDGDNKL